MEKSNPQAFPSLKNDSIYTQDKGMTLRDYFMAHCPEVPDWYYNWKSTCDNDEIVYFSWRSYYADAMLAERGKRDE